MSDAETKLASRGWKCWEAATTGDSFFLSIMAGKEISDKTQVHYYYYYYYYYYSYYYDYCELQLLLLLLFMLMLMVFVQDRKNACRCTSRIKQHARELSSSAQQHLSYFAAPRPSPMWGWTNSDTTWAWKKPNMTL